MGAAEWAESVSAGSPVFKIHYMMRFILRRCLQVAYLGAADLMNAELERLASMRSPKENACLCLVLGE